MASAGKTLQFTNDSKKTEKRGNIKKMTLTAMLAAIAVILMYMEIPAGLIYKKKSDKKGAVIASVTGTVAMSLLSIVSNYFFVYPIYYNFMPKDVILKAYQAIFPGVHSILQALVVFNVPFTMLKGLISVVIAWLLYLPLAPMMRIED